MAKKRNVTITMDADDINRIRDMGMSVSKFTSRSIASFLTEGFEDYMAALKIQLLEGDINDLCEEKAILSSRIDDIDIQLGRLEELHERATETYEMARTVGRLSRLTQQLNKSLIFNSYDVDMIDSELIKDIIMLNPEFDLIKHRDSLIKILGY